MMSGTQGLAEALESAEAAAKAAAQLDRTIRAIDSLRRPELEAISARVLQLSEGLAAMRQGLAELALTGTALVGAGVSGEEIAAIQGTMENVRAHSKAFNAAVDDLNRKLGVELARAYSEAGARSADQWSKRWGDYAKAAERELGALVESINAGRASVDIGSNPNWPLLTDKDIAIAEMFYSGGLTQKEIGVALGLSQPAIAGRLPKIDGAIAELLVARELTEVGITEGWDISSHEIVDVGNASLHFDILASRSEGNKVTAELGIEIKTYKGNEPVAYGHSRVAQSSSELGITVGLAFYDLGRNMMGILVESDFNEALEKVVGDRREAPGTETFGDVRSLLPTDLSLNSALERAGG